MKKILLALAMITCAISTFSQTNYRDIVHLKNGGIVKGVIIEQVPNKQIKVETSDGSVFVYEMDEIEKMSKEKISDTSNTWRKDNRQHYSSPTAKGKVMLAGSSDLSFSSISPEGGDSQSEFKIRPTIGTFVADNFGIGVMLNYEDYENRSLFLLGPIVRYYFGTSNIKPFLQGEYMFGNYKYEGIFEDTDIKSDVNAYAIGGGAAFFLNQYISIDFGLGYNKMSFGDSDSDGIVINGGISVYF